MIGIFRRKVDNRIDIDKVYDEVAKTYENDGDTVTADILRMNRDQLIATLAYLGDSVGRSEVRRAVNFARDTVR